MVTLSAGFMVATSAMASDALVMSIFNFVAADDMSRLRKKLKSKKVKLRNIYVGGPATVCLYYKFRCKKRPLRSAPIS
jgi:hypothetical protein